MTRTTKGILAAVASALCLSFMGILGKLLFQQGVHPLNVVTLRAIVAFATLALALTLVRRRVPTIRASQLPFFAMLGLIGISLNYASFFLALELHGLHRHFAPLHLSGIRRARRRTVPRRGDDDGKGERAGADYRRMLPGDRRL